MPADNFQAVRYYMLLPSHWVQAIQSHNLLMSTYIALSTGTPVSSLPDKASQVSHIGLRRIRTGVVRSRTRPLSNMGKVFAENRNFTQGFVAAGRQGLISQL